MGHLNDLYAHRRQDGRGLVIDPGAELLPTPPHLIGIRAEDRRRNASRPGRSRPSREIRHLKSRLRDIAEGTLSGAVDPRWTTVAVQAYSGFQ
jgi:hypothetical protein